MEEEKGRNNKGIFPAAILFTAEISHVIPAGARVASVVKHTPSERYTRILTLLNVPISLILHLYRYRIN